MGVCWVTSLLSWHDENVQNSTRTSRRSIWVYPGFWKDINQSNAMDYLRIDIVYRLLSGFEDFAHFCLCLSSRFSFFCDFSSWVRFSFQRNLLLFQFFLDIIVIWDGFPQGSRREKRDVSLISFVTSEQSVRSMQVIQDSQNSKAISEFQMVKIMSFRRRHEWKMVARMRIQSGEQGQKVPSPSCGNMRATKERSHENRK